MKCVECGKRVSTTAVSCPHCGAVQPATAQVAERPKRPPRVRASIKKFLLWSFAALIAVSVVGQIVGTQGKAGGTGATVAREFGCDVKKADGSAAGRDCDLVELCKDAKHFNRKFEKASLDGNVVERNAAGTELKKLLVWMSQYRPEDVAAVCDGKVPATSTPAPVVGAGTTMAKVPPPPAMTFANGACSAPPLELFPVGYAFTSSELQLELAQKCPGAGIGQDGRIAVLWKGDSYAVELTSHREPNGLLIHQVRAVRTK